MASGNSPTASRATRRRIDFAHPLVLAAGALTSCLLWGSAIPCVRMGYQLLGIDASDTGSQLIFAGVRFLMAGAVVVMAHSFATRSLSLPNARDTWAAARISIFQTFGQYLLYYIGLAHSTGVSGAISQGIDVFASLLISAVIFRMERLTPRKVAGSLIGFAGILLADAGSRTAGGGGFTLTGEGFVMLATVSSAFASVLTRRYAQKSDPVVLCGWQFMMGGLGLLACGSALGGRFVVRSLAGAAVLGWLVVVSAVAYAIWSILLKDNDVSRVSIYTFTLPIFGVILSLLILGDEGGGFGLLTLVALVLVSLGILLVEREPVSR